MNNSNSKLKLGILWNVSGTIASKIFVMFASIITARMLGADKNGEFSMINSTIGMFSTFAALGLGTTATRFIAEHKHSNKEKCGRIIALTFALALSAALLLSLILLFTSDWLAENTLNNKNLSIGLKISCITLIFNTINIIQNSILSGFEDFKSLAQMSLFQGLISLPIFLILTSLLDVNGLVLGYGIVAFVCCIFTRRKITKSCDNHSIKILYRSCLKEYNILITFALPSLLMNVVVMPITWLGNTIISADINGYLNLGIFNAANQWRAAIVLLPTAIGNVILPYIISSKSNKTEDINILLSWIIVTIISSFVMLISSIITILYGSGYPFYDLNASIVIICALCMLLSFKEGVARNLVKYNRMWFAFISNLLWGSCYIVCVLLLKKYGSIGISLATLLSYILSTVVFIPFYIKNKIVDKKYFIDKNIIKVWISFILYFCLSLITNVIQIKLILFLITIYFILKLVRHFFGINIKETIKGVLKND